ncbi:hypothetical protein Tsp_13965 [Trichinella spiralis]|uniref:hypothetical protein n=1 Tax=Trichinella spiralis TaxID=6334 RepID=UPI0001EFDEC9|nr:hypothetical protein Tsp_13965 [Trichinella spiralis]
MKQIESENAEDTNQTTDDKKQNERRQERCAMQIAIAIKGGLSSVRAHSFV